MGTLTKCGWVLGAYLMFFSFFLLLGLGGTPPLEFQYFANKIVSVRVMCASAETAGAGGHFPTL